jgi:hypothetical protein
VKKKKAAPKRRKVVIESHAIAVVALVFSLFASASVIAALAFLK